MRPVKTIRVLAIALLLLAGGWLIGRDGAAERKPLGLFTSLPILWNEASDVAGLLKPDIQPHWAKAALQARGDIVALDRLDALASSGLTRLVIAQPRPLSPEENVALDNWVKRGGRLLLRMLDDCVGADLNRILPGNAASACRNPRQEK